MAEGDPLKEAARSSRRSQRLRGRWTDLVNGVRAAHRRVPARKSHFIAKVPALLGDEMRTNCSLS